jgi:hypothetical protein
LVLPCGVAAQDVPEWVTRTRLSGLAFGDYYWIASSDNEELSGQHGWWFRRIYVTMDTELGGDFDFRFRLEARSPGDFESSVALIPFVKDAWVRWRLKRQQFYLGIVSDPTWELVEGTWGYRDVEKTPLDLQRMGSSRDFGVSGKGPISRNGVVQYHAMLGNGSSTRGELNEGKKAYLALNLFPGDFIIQAYADFEQRDENADRSTLQGFAAWRTDAGRVGVQFAHQERDEGEGVTMDLDVLSVWGVWNASEKLSLLARYDKMFDPNPEAEKIPYVPFSSLGKSNLVLVGLDWTLVDRFHLIPNIQAVFYDAAGDTEAPASEVIPRITFSVTF